MAIYIKKSKDDGRSQIGEVNPQNPMDTSVSAPAEQPKAQTVQQPVLNQPTSNFTPSYDTDTYKSKLADYENDEPSAYSSAYESTIAEILDTIKNKGKFDLSTDANYQQIYNNYKESYQNQANKAMRDTMANAQLASGGYGNTYAQAVAQQAYDDTMSGLNDNNINLMNLAYGMYQDDVANDYNKLSAYQNQDNIEYSRYRDDYNDWYNNRNYYANQYQNSYANDYTDYRNQISDTNNMYEQALNYASNGYQLPSYLSSQMSAEDNQYFSEVAQQALQLAMQKASGKGKTEQEISDTDIIQVAEWLKTGMDESAVKTILKDNGYSNGQAEQIIYNARRGKGSEGTQIAMSANMTPSENYYKWVTVLNECEKLGKTSDEEITAAMAKAGVDEASAAEYRQYIKDEEARIARSK